MRRVGNPSENGIPCNNYMADGGLGQIRRLGRSGFSGDRQGERAVLRRERAALPPNGMDIVSPTVARPGAAAPQDSGTTL